MKKLETLLEKYSKLIRAASLAIYFIVCFMVYYKDACRSSFFGFGSRKFFLFFLISLVCFLMICLLFLLRNRLLKKGLPYFFSITVLLLGLTYILITPILQTPDESPHFMRAYEISMGHLTSMQGKDGAGRELPKSFYDITNAYKAGLESVTYSSVKETILNPLNPKDVQFWDFWNTALYFPISYIPQAIGVFIGRVLDLPIMLIGYLGRLFNLLFWVGCCYLAVKIVPRNKSFFMLLFLSPMAIHILSSMSADVMINGLSIVFLACILDLKFSDKILSAGYLAILGFFFVAISMCKIVYLPLCLLFFLIPVEKARTKFIYFFWFFTMFTVAFICNYLWAKMVMNFVIQHAPLAEQQINFILSSPFSYFIIIVRTLFERAFFYVNLVFVGDMGWVNIPVYSIFSIVYLLMTFHHLSRAKTNEAAFGIKDKAICASVLIGVVVLIISSIYVQCTTRMANEVGYYIAHGVQGRYFWPVIILLPVLFGNNLTGKDDEKFAVNAFYLSMIVNLPCMLNLVAFYIV